MILDHVVFACNVFVEPVDDVAMGSSSEVQVQEENSPNETTDADREQQQSETVSDND